MSFNTKILSKKQIQEIKKSAVIARKSILTMTTLASSGHPGGSMSTLDLLLTLYKMADVDPKNPLKNDRDRIVISHGHISPAVYSTLAINGFFNLDDAISQFRLAGSFFEGHIETDVPGVEWGTGNLGQGLSAGTGFSLACKLKNIKNQTFVFMGDGEQQKGQLSEARRFAIKHKLNNITAVVDYNRLQISGNIENVMFQDIKANYESDGWEVIEIDGHDIEQISNAYIKSVENDKPTMILANTVMGKDVSFMENKEKYHGSPLSEEQLDSACKELNITNEIDKYKKLRENFKLPTKKLIERRYDFDINTDGNLITDKKLDNRSAWGNAIADIASKNNDSKTPIVVFDCDLAGSVKTSSFAKESPNYFIQTGIMEHHAAVAAGVMSLENLQVFFADFGVFGVDETYNQHRLNDINHANLKVITTHNGLDVGEDGKTHQCIDYVGTFSNLFGFKVIVPCCPNQTDHIIRDISAKEGNYLVVMGRSKMEPALKSDGTIFYDENYKFEYGKPDMLRDGNDGALFVMGSLSRKAIDVVDQLAKDGINIQLWHCATPLSIDKESLEKAASTKNIFTYEDHNHNTGLGNSIALKLVDNELSSKLTRFGVTQYGASGNAESLFKHFELDTESIIKKIKEKIR